jgi:hypothetical protein
MDFDKEFELSAKHSQEFDEKMELKAYKQQQIEDLYIFSKTLTSSIDAGDEASIKTLQEL